MDEPRLWHSTAGRLERAPGAECCGDNPSQAGGGLQVGVGARKVSGFRGLGFEGC